MSFNPKVFGADCKSYGQVGTDPNGQTDATGVADVQATTAPSRLYSVTASNESVGTLWLFVFDAASEPAEGKSPLFKVRVAADDTGAFDWQDGIPMAKGIYVCWSSTKTVKTKAGSTSGYIATTHRKSS